MSSEITYECVTCQAKHTAPRDGALALLKLCKTCGTKRYADGKLEQRKKTTPPQAEKPTGDR